MQSNSVSDNLQYQPYQITYLTFEQLSCFPPNADLAAIGSQLASQIFSSSNWQSQFEAITSLRVFNKNYPHQINDIFLNFGMQILSYVESIKTCILKNSLLFINEVFLVAQKIKLNDVIIDKIVPILLQKSIDESKLISTPAQEALSTFCSGCFLYDSSYKCIIKAAVCAKSTNIQENSLKILQQLMMNCGQNIMNLQNETFEHILKGIVIGIQNNRLQISSLFKKLMEQMNNILGNQNYINLIQNLLNEEEQKIIRDNYEEIFTKQNKPKCKNNQNELQMLKTAKKIQMGPKGYDLQVDIKTQGFHRPVQEQQLNQYTFSQHQFQ